MSCHPPPGFKGLDKAPPVNHAESNQETEDFNKKNHAWHGLVTGSIELEPTIDTYRYRYIYRYIYIYKYIYYSVLVVSA